MLVDITKLVMIKNLESSGEGYMLVLSRKTDEALIIGDDIKITVLDIRGGQVRIGISAPPSVKIHREKIYDKISSMES